jgi:hypothetical protein
MESDDDSVDSFRSEEFQRAQNRRKTLMESIKREENVKKQIEE